jgi:hypothetical protein
MTKDEKTALENRIKELEEETFDLTIQAMVDLNTFAIKEFMYEQQVKALKCVNALFLQNKKLSDFDRIDIDLDQERMKKP